MKKFDISKFVYKSIQHVAKDTKSFLKKSKQDPISRKPNIAIWHLIKNINPSEFYAYLNVKFGPPNGMQNLFKSDDSDNLFHWHYMLYYEDQHFDIMCSSYRIEILHPFEFEDRQYALDSYLLDSKADYINHKNGITQFMKKLEKWQVFINPFFHNKSMMEYQVKALDEIDIPSLEHFDKHLTPDSIAEFTELSNNFVKATSLAFNIRILAPIYAESFINTLIFLLSEDDIKNDRRLYDNIIRQNIDIRIKQLHRNCKGFTYAVDYNHIEACKNLQRLFDNRNNLLHGNIDPSKSVYDTYYFEGKTPLPTQFKPMFTQAHSASLKMSSPEKAFEDYQTVQDFITYVLLCLDEKTHAVVQQFLATQDPGWNQETKRVGILFPRHYIDGYAQTDIPTFYSQ